MDKLSPTQEQIKEFWEWCGFYYKRIPWKNSYYFEWTHPDYDYHFMSYPEIDLNNLFKYAVPKLKDSMEKKHPNGIDGRHYTFINLCNWLSGVLDGEDPALALFWAIWEVMHDKA